MAYSNQEVVSNGTLVLLDISINYLERDEVHVSFDNVENALPWAWVGTSDHKIAFSPAVPNGVVVLVNRATNLAAPRHVFSTGAAFTAESLDEDIAQILHIAQEASEGSLGGDYYQDINMHGNQVTNLGNAVSPSDAVPLSQYQADASGAYTSKVEAAASAASALSSKNSATASATSAGTSAGTASSAASTATTKASEAAVSASAALASQVAVTSTYDSFDDRYLGSKSTEPTVDNDGAALLSGALFFHSGVGMKVWNATAWELLGGATTGLAPVASPSFTGPVSINDGLGEGQIHVGANDGYFFANSGEAGWYSPTLGSFKYNFSTDQLSINGQTAWHQGNDGAGSGLDADLLDGQQGSYYAPVANPTFTGMARSDNSRATLSWTGAQFMAYSATGAAVDFASTAYHVQDAGSAPQWGFNYGDSSRFGLYDTGGTVRVFTVPVSGIGNGLLKIVSGDVTVAAAGADYATPASVPIAPGSAPIYACRAWVNFNGTGTPAIRASGNVSSITDNGLGNYTVNFTTAMIDANYAAAVNLYGIDGARTYSSTIRYESLLSTSCQITVGRSDNTGGFINGDSSIITVSIFR